MNRIERQCNPVQGAAFGQTPTLELQLGPRYRSLLFEIIVNNGYTGGAGKIPTILDVLDLITIKIGGNPQRTHTAWELDMIHKSFGAQYGLNTYNYMANANGQKYANGVPAVPVVGNAGTTIQTVFYLPIFFREPWRGSYAARDMMAWYTAWSNGSVLPSFTVELKIPAATTNVDATKGITINCYAEIDNAVGPLDNNKNPVAMITKWKRQGLVYGGPGDLVITSLNKAEIYNQISLFSAYGTGKGPLASPSLAATLITDQNDIVTPAFDAIERVKVEVDNVTVRDVSKTTNDQMLVGDDFNESGLPPDRFDIVFDKSDLPTDGLIMQAGGATVKDFRITATIGGNAAAVALNKSISALMQIYGAIEK
jgi:hypothetical protein